MKRLLVFQHVAHEVLGTLDPLLREHGFRIRYVNFGRQPEARPTLSRHDGLIVLGGPMNCDQRNRYPHLDFEMQAIRDFMGYGRPVLGICLGAQLVASALGARVQRNPVREIGWYRVDPTPAADGDTLFRHLARPEMIFQWHADTFELPDGAVHLARSETCENQAFRHGDSVYGLQFHLEVDAPMIHRWLRAPVNLRELECDGGISPAAIERMTQRHIGRARSLGTRVFRSFIDLFSNRHRRRPLPSR